MATINLGRIKPIWQGAWSSSTAYVTDDIVYYNNSAWIAQASNTNSAPSGVNANWELMALGTDIPSQTSQSGKYLTTNGSALSWSTITAPVEYSVVSAGTTTNRSLAGDSGWVTHLSVTFTTTQACTVMCFGNFSAGYESGPVFLAGRFYLDSDSTTTQDVQIFKQGLGSNMAFGAHSMSGFFTSVSAGSHTVVLQLRNYGGSSTAITNYFDDSGAGDRIWILYK